MNHQKILEALKSREYHYDTFVGGRNCPDCKRAYYKPHATDCPYDQAIREVEEAIAHK